MELLDAITSFHGFQSLQTWRHKQNKRNKCHLLHARVLLHIESTSYSNITLHIRGIQWHLQSENYNGWKHSGKHVGWGVDHTGQFRHHTLTSPAVIVWKVVDQHLFLNIIPINFMAGTGRKVWCDRDMRACLKWIPCWKSIGTRAELKCLASLEHENPTQGRPLAHMKNRRKIHWWGWQVHVLRSPHTSTLHYERAHSNHKAHYKAKNSLNSLWR